MAFNESLDFVLNELSIVAKDGKKYDIKQIYGELSIFDSLTMPVMSGNVLIRDSVGLSDALFFDGSEVLLVDISKVDKADPFNMRSSFRIYQQTNRKSDRPTSESYLLHFVSDEMIFSDQLRVNQFYENNYSEIAKKILIDYLKISKDKIGIETSKGIKSVVIPNLRPLEAINWCAARAVDDKLSPNFMFFENITGFNFLSLSEMLIRDSIIDIKFDTKNIIPDQPLLEMNSARSLEVISQANSIRKIRTGVNAGKYIAFDPVTRSIQTKLISFGDIYGNMDHGNQTPNFSVLQNRDGSVNYENYDSRKSLGLFSTLQKQSNYIKKKDPTSISKLEDYENFVFQRRAIFENLYSARLKIVMPGNLQLSSGFNVNVQAPVFGKRVTGYEKEDSSIDGKYVITASRNIFNGLTNKHETIIEVATTSNKRGFIDTSSSQQTDEAKNYDNYFVF